MSARVRRGIATRRMDGTDVINSEGDVPHVGSLVKRRLQRRNSQRREVARLGGSVYGEVEGLKESCRGRGEGGSVPKNVSWFLTSRAETTTKEPPTLDRIHVVPRHGQLTLISRRVEHGMRPIDIDERVDLLEESRGVRCDVHLG